MSYITEAYPGYFNPSPFFNGVDGVPKIHNPLARIFEKGQEVFVIDRSHTYDAYDNNTYHVRRLFVREVKRSEHTFAKVLCCDDLSDKPAEDIEFDSRVVYPLKEVCELALPDPHADD